MDEMDRMNREAHAQPGGYPETRQAALSLL